jgi:hypothetical protein
VQATQRTVGARTAWAGQSARHRAAQWSRVVGGDPREALCRPRRALSRSLLADAADADAPPQPTPTPPRRHRPLANLRVSRIASVPSAGAASRQLVQLAWLFGLVSPREALNRPSTSRRRKCRRRRWALPPGRPLCSACRPGRSRPCQASSRGPRRRWRFRPLRLVSHRVAAHACALQPARPATHACRSPLYALVLQGGSCRRLRRSWRCRTLTHVC